MEVELKNNIATKLRDRARWQHCFNDRDAGAKEIDRLTEALLDATAHLAGAASAYEKYARRYKQRGPTDPFFKTRSKDFKDAESRARKALANVEE